MAGDFAQRQLVGRDGRRRVRLLQLGETDDAVNRAIKPISTVRLDRLDEIAQTVELDIGLGRQFGVDDVQDEREGGTSGSGCSRY